MKNLDKRIADAKEALEKAEEGTPERAAAQARFDELTSIKEDGIGFTQDDLNRVDRQAKDGYENSIKDVLGMTLEETKQVMASVEESLVGDGESGEGNGDGNVLERMQSALKERDDKIGTLSSSHEDFQRRYYTERVTNRLGEAFRSAGLQDKYLTPAQRLASYDELIEKSMKGEEVKDEEFTAISDSVKEQAPVFFEPERNDDYPDIPPAPNGETPAELTDQQRAERSAPVF